MSQSTISPAPQDARVVLPRLGVLPWHDPSVDPHGFDPRSPYVETFWLPLLGPSTTLLLRRLADAFDDAPDGFELDCVDVSREIGLGNRLTKRAPFVRTLDRSIKFGMAQLSGDVLHVRRTIPRLNPRQIAKLSARLRDLHHGWLPEDTGDSPETGQGAQRREQVIRATHLARTLRSLGETDLAVERQLQSWHFAPGVAWHAVQLLDRDDIAVM